LILIGEFLFCLDYSARSAKERYTVVVVYWNFPALRRVHDLSCKFASERFKEDRKVERTTGIRSEFSWYCLESRQDIVFQIRSLAICAMQANEIATVFFFLPSCQIRSLGKNQKKNRRNRRLQCLARSRLTTDVFRALATDRGSPRVWRSR
jgi:hypothetical protein